MSFDKTWILILLDYQTITALKKMYGLMTFVVNVYCKHQNIKSTTPECAACTTFNTFVNLDRLDVNGKNGH